MNVVRRHWTPLNSSTLSPNGVAIASRDEAIRLTTVAVGAAIATVALTTVTRKQGDDICWFFPRWSRRSSSIGEPAASSGRRLNISRNFDQIMSKNVLSGYRLQWLLRCSNMALHNGQIPCPSRLYVECPLIKPTTPFKWITLNIVVTVTEMMIVLYITVV